MDKFEQFSAVNLGDESEVNYHVSSDESDNSSADCDDISDESDGESLDVGEGNLKRISELTADEIRELDFGSEEEAYDFYQKYAKCHGFVIRKHDVARDARKKVIMRQYVCNRHGLRDKKHLARVDRKRDHRPITRTGCEARLRVHYKMKTSRWIVTLFIEAHNHELTPSRYVHLFPSYRGLTNADKAQVDSLHSYGIRTCHIMGYMVAQKGGYEGVGFSKKDLYNYFDSKFRGEIKDGDVVSALSYLHGKADNDPMLYAKFSITSDGRLKHLFWADGCSRSDFECFGDVLAFDTTYRKNKYNYPLVIFSGCNHHSQTIIFGCALVSDETTDTYKWVLNSFLEAMGNKHPKAVVTDGDGAMREAIRQVFPDACHRLCAWHLHKNACENVKCSPFLDDFKKAMYSNFTIDEFEEFWMDMVVKHGLVGNKWVCKTYDNKTLWATAYFREKFFGRIRTTSQCESINSIIKMYVRKKCSIFEFIHNFEQALREYRNNELVADFKSLFSEPVLTTGLQNIEKDAAKIYTAEIFKEVREQIVKCAALIVTERVVNGERLIFKLTKYCDRSCERKVVYDTTAASFYCVCRRFESRGIPCSHIFCVMKEEHVDRIPTSLILTRWTKNAKSVFMSSDSVDGVDPDVMELARFASYCGACTRFCKIAAKKKGHYEQVMDDILKLTNKYDKYEDSDSQTSSLKNFCDPNMVKTKGAPKKKKFGPKRTRRCSNCTSTKHNARTCPMRVSTEGNCMNVDQISHSDSSESSLEAEIDKEAMTSELNKSQFSVRSNNTNSHNDKRGKGKVTSCSNRKQKKAKELSQNSNNDSVATSSRGHPVVSQMQQIVPPMQFPTYGQGMSNLHNYGGVPVYPKNVQVPFIPQVNQYFYGMPPFNNATSCFELLQQVMQKGDQGSGKNETL